MTHTTRLALVLCAAVWYGFAAADDLTVVSNVTTNGRPAGTDTTYLTGDHIRTSRSVEVSIDAWARTSRDGSCGSCSANGIVEFPSTS